LQEDHIPNSCTTRTTVGAYQQWRGSQHHGVLRPTLLYTNGKRGGGGGGVPTVPWSVDKLSLVSFHYLDSGASPPWGECAAFLGARVIPTYTSDE